MSFNENGIQNGKNQNWKIQNQETIQLQKQHNTIQSHQAVVSSDGGLHQRFPLETKAGVSRQPGGGGDVTTNVKSQSGVTTNVRTDFSGLFTTGGQHISNSNRDFVPTTEPALPPTTRIRHRNASRAQKPLHFNTVATCINATTPYSPFSSTSNYAGQARSSDLQELQFEVDCCDEEEDGMSSANSRPDSMTEANEEGTTDNLNEVNFPNFFLQHNTRQPNSGVNHATKKSFNSPHVEHCATVGSEAIDYFSTGGFSQSQLDTNSVSSGKQGNVQNTEQLHPHIVVGGGEQRCIFDGSGIIGNAAVAAVDHFGQVAERPPSKRQRHFSLEDYNDLVMESSNSNASNENSNDDNNMMMLVNGGGGDTNPTSSTSALTSFANLGKFFSNFSSSPLSRRNSFSATTNNQQAGGEKCNNEDTLKSFIGTNFGCNNYHHPGDGFMPSAAEEYDVNLDSDNSIITRHLRAELENRLVMAINFNDDDIDNSVDNVNNDGSSSDSIRSDNICEQQTTTTTVSSSLSSPKLKFPDNLVSVIAGHVIQESSLEPCGLKGCVIYIYLEDDDGCQYVNCLRCDPETVPTFELTLTLRSSSSSSSFYNPFFLTRSQSSTFATAAGGRRISWIVGDRGLLPSIVRNFRQNPTKPVSILVSTSYKLVKRRKYRLNESPQQLCL